MPATERRMRWERMMDKIRSGTIHQWFAGFVEALEDAHAARKGAGQLPAQPSRFARPRLTAGSQAYH
jgi:trehalose 6-phosphate synthase